MIANPGKFKALIIAKDKRETKGHIINLGNVEITPNDAVDLLSVTLDNKLMFDHHINELCTKAGGQLNALKRLGPFISKKTGLAMTHAFIFSTLTIVP